MAAQTALAAGARNLIMSHFSPRYAPGNAIELKDLLEEGQAIFPNTKMAYASNRLSLPASRHGARALPREEHQQAKSTVATVLLHTNPSR